MKTKSKKMSSYTVLVQFKDEEWIVDAESEDEALEKTIDLVSSEESTHVVEKVEILK